MDLLNAIIFGIVEGVTEFLPISSTGHLTITEKLLGYKIDDPAITAFTAVIQIGAILAVLVYFWRDIVQIVSGWLSGIFRASERDNYEYRFGWAIILGSIPIGIIGLLFKDQIETDVRSLWVVAIALIVWSGVLWLADRAAQQNRHEKDVTWQDTLVIGLVQCIALIPGISRSGATISAGLLRGFDRVEVTRLSFFLAVPALLAAGTLEAVDRAGDITRGVGWSSTILATVISFVVAYISIAWLLRFVAKNSFTVFIVYRIILGVLLLVLLAAGSLSAV